MQKKFLSCFHYASPPLKCIVQFLHITLADSIFKLHGFNIISLQVFKTADNVDISLLSCQILIKA